MKINRMLKLLSALLMILVFAGPLYGCASTPNEEEPTTLQPTTESFEEIFETILSEQFAEIKEITETTETTVITEETIVDCALELIDEEFYEPSTLEDLAGNFDVFVYGLLINRGEGGYDFFNATIELEDGNAMYGIAYTDFANYFEVVDKDENDPTEGYFAAGFIPYIDEPLNFEVVDRACVEGLEIVNTDVDDDRYSFVMAYDLNEFTSHCVVWNQYLKYGIDELGDIVYSVEEYVDGSYDKTLGTLYSFDEKKNLYEGNIGGGMPLTGDSLSNQVDYVEMQNIIDEIIANQDDIFANVEVETCVYIAQERLNAYLLSLQEETFMGFDVDELIAISADLDPMQCIQITPNGILINEILEEIPEEPTAFVKWMTGSLCAIALVVSIVGTIYVRSLTPLWASLSSAAIDVFLQVVIENRTLDNVSWGKVVIAAAAAAAFTWLSPKIAELVSIGNSVIAKALNASGSLIAKIASISYKSGLILSNSVLGGCVGAANSYIDGKSDENVFNAFVIGAALSGGFTAMGILLKPVGNELAKKITENRFMSNVLKDVTTHIEKHQVRLFSNSVEEFLTPSTYEKTMMFVKDIVIDSNVNFVGRSYAECMKIKMGYALLNKNGVEIINPKTGEVISSGFEKIEECRMYITDSTSNAAVFLKENGYDYIVLKYGVPDVAMFSKCDIKMTVSPYRNVNFREAGEIIQEKYNNNDIDLPDEVEEVIGKYIKDNGLTKLEIGWKELQTLIREAGYTYHEEVGKNCIVPTVIHKFIGHAGGVYQAKVVQVYSSSSSMIDKLAECIPNSFLGTLMVT